MQNVTNIMEYKVTEVELAQNITDVTDMLKI